MVPSWMTRQIAKKQQLQLNRLIRDRDFARREAHAPLQACLGDWLSPDAGGLVLELGCGPGKYVPILAALGYEVMAVDPIEFSSWEQLKNISGVSLRSKILAEQLPFADESFDHAVCLGALLYFEDPDAALRELRRVMKPGGKLVLRTVNRGNLYTARTGKVLDPASKHLFNINELQGLLGAHGFQINHAFSFGFMSPACTNFWWYLTSVWLPSSVQSFLSQALPDAKRHNITVFCSRN